VRSVDDHAEFRVGGASRLDLVERPQRKARERFILDPKIERREIGQFYPVRGCAAGWIRSAWHADSPTAGMLIGRRSLAVIDLGRRDFGVRRVPPMPIDSALMPHNLLDHLRKCDIAERALFEMIKTNLYLALPRLDVTCTTCQVLLAGRRARAGGEERGRSRYGARSPSPGFG
jgi:hypothetical protein